MKKVTLSITILCLCIIYTQAQKPSISFSTFGKWPEIINPLISNDGKYVYYTINNLPLQSETLMIQATNKSWKKEILGAKDAYFSPKVDYIIFRKNSDTLCLLKLGTDEIRYISEINSYKLSNGLTENWLAYQLNDSVRKFTLLNLITHKTISYENVLDYCFSNNGKYLLIKSKIKESNADKKTLKLINLAENKSNIIWKGDDVISYTFDKKGEQLAFISRNNENEESVNSLWYYKTTMDSAILRAKNYSYGIDKDLVINDSKPIFSNDCNKIFFTLKKKENEYPKIDAVKVDVWSYKDTRLQSFQLQHPINHQFIAVINIKEDLVIRLEQLDEEIIGNVSDYDGQYLLVKLKNGISQEYNWNKISKTSISLISILNGNRILLNDSIFSPAEYFDLSPTGESVIYYDQKEKNYFNYNIKTTLTKNITRSIKKPLYNEEDDHPSPFPIPFNWGKPIWLPAHNTFLIYDQFDIWLIDPSGKNNPRNLTNGYGRKNNIIFRIAEQSNKITSENGYIILTAFQTISKESGFYKVSLTRNSDPQLLTMGPYVYNLRGIGSISSKNNNYNAYIVMRMSCGEYPNLYFSKDLRKYNKLSNIHPQKNYNWIQNELVKWPSYKGDTLLGILYKPEDFDSTKKYPIIYYFYEKSSNTLNQFILPEASDGRLNISYFASNGYLVFIPDITYAIGNPGESVYSSVISSAKYLSKKGWVDSTKMGLQGISWGGYQVNYLISKTNIFAAAASSSGMSDLISDYGQISHGGISRSFFYEVGQVRMGVTLWENPDLYIKNSPIFFADKVTTPLLLMSNKGDSQVSWFQGIEYFVALRRLRKKVWMLQYDEGGHGVSGKEALDYTMRLSQFFNYYLKGCRPPMWMTKGVPAELKGIFDGEKLDSGDQIP
jgi:dipeptidyl aminopeptidase/acylaminoacyl peptidase